MRESDASNKDRPLKSEAQKKKKIVDDCIANDSIYVCPAGSLSGFYLLHNFWNHSQEKQPDQPAEQAGENKQAATVNLTFVGDVILTGHVETRLKENGYDFPYVHVHPYFQQDDFTVANLETPVTKTVHQPPTKSSSTSLHRRQFQL